MKEDGFAWSSISIVEFSERVKIMKKQYIPRTMTKVSRVRNRCVEIEKVN